MMINCRSCQKNKPLPVVIALHWNFRCRILFCLDCVPEDVHVLMMESENRYWKNRI